MAVMEQTHTHIICGCIFIKRKGGRSDCSTQEVKSEKIELLAAVLKLTTSNPGIQAIASWAMYLGFRNQVEEADHEQFGFLPAA